MAPNDITRFLGTLLLVGQMCWLEGEMTVVVVVWWMVSSCWSCGLEEIGGLSN